MLHGPGDQPHTWGVDYPMYQRSRKIFNRFRMTECNPIEAIFERASAVKITEQPYRELLGSLVHVMAGRWPDLCYSIAFEYVLLTYTRTTSSECGSLERHLVYQNCCRHSLISTGSKVDDWLTSSHL